MDGAEVGRPEWSDAFAPPAEDQDGSKPRGRDERHRERLRETEADRDRLAGLVETMRAAEIQRLAIGLADPRDLFRDGATVADMLDDDGQVDPAKGVRRGGQGVGGPPPLA